MFRPTLLRSALTAAARASTPRQLQHAAFPMKRTARFYSNKNSGLADIDPTKLAVTKHHAPGELLNEENLVFGRTFSDHMLAIEWNSTTGWGAPHVKPYQNLSLDPATCVFHYGFSCFEGMKAYRTSSGDLRLFRPKDNMERMNKSCQRIALPGFNPDAMAECIAKFVALEEKYVPKRRGYSLYLRPTMIGTQATLGVGPPGSALFFMIASPVGPYYPTGFKAVSLEATSKYVRAWPGGTGDKKLGGNYAPCIVPQLEAASRGYHQNLWLFGEEGYITEVGTMNLFTAWINEDGQKELITAPLDGTILEGITRDSILALAREFLTKEGYIISEKKYTIKQMSKAADEGRLLEVFGAGTAAVVSPVRKIAWDGGNTGVAREIEVPLPAGKEAGPIAERMWKWMEERQYGDVESEWSYPVKPAY